MGDDISQLRRQSERRRQALAAASVLGIWEWDHNRKVARYCPGAAGVLAGDENLAGRDLTMRKALAGVYTDAVACLRTQMRRAASAPGVRLREHRVHAERHGVRRVLCRGQTYYDADGKPTCTMGVVIDVTDIEADGRKRFAIGDDTLESAAEHAIMIYEAIQAAGVSRLAEPARILLMAIGREIARGLSKGVKRLH